jgi:hypothetical protein
VEQLEVAKSIAQGFKLPEGLVLERLQLKGRAPELAPIRRPAAPATSKRLAGAERQLIQALGQNAGLAEAIRPLIQDAFWKDAWSWPAIEQMILSPGNLDAALGVLTDDDLQRQVREAILEPAGPMTMEHAEASIQKLYDAHLVKMEQEIRNQLQQCGSAGGPADLLEKLGLIAKKRRQMVELFRPRA